MDSADTELRAGLAKLAPFALRSHTVETGREKLLQHRHQLAFLLISTDLSENSRTEVLREFPCLIFQALSMEEMAQYFGFQGTKIVGFRRCSLSTQIQKLLKGYRILAEAVTSITLPQHPKVAILGASGIGQHHAFWWHLDGAQVVAFLGSCAESNLATAAKLKASLGDSPKAYLNLEKLLENERPDIVDVCLPDFMHFDAAKAALAAGCHVLCEKPLVFSRDLKTPAMLAQADELIELAGAHRRLFGMTSQYHPAALACKALCPNPAAPVRTFQMELFAPLRKHESGALSAWIDLGPHLLAAVQAIAEGRRLQGESLEIHMEGDAFQAAFRCEGEAPQPPLQCRLLARHLPATTANSVNRRFLSLDGNQFDCRGFHDDHGIFQVDLHSLPGDVAHRQPDFLHTLLGQFQLGRVLFPGALARQNLAWLLQIRDAALQSVSKGSPVS